MVRRAFKTREVGHAGTLDPMATGVLVVALGEATKLVPYLTQATKIYDARISLGVETDTLDALGSVTRQAGLDLPLVRELDAFGDASTALSGGARVARAALDELARVTQTPPAFSAIRSDGERAYARARRGEDVVLEARPVRVHSLEVMAAQGSPTAWLDIRVKADKGYYVRSLGRDLACRLGTVGHLVLLRRLESGGFTEEEAVDPRSGRETLVSNLISLPAAARRALPARTLTTGGAARARFGQRVPPADFETPAPEAPSAWFDPSGALVAVGVLDAGDGRVLRGFSETRPVDLP